MPGLIKHARNMYIYDNTKRADKSNLWILLLTEWVIRLAENLADVGKSNIYRYYLQNDFRFLIVNCALKNYKCVNSQLIVAESLNSQYNQCVNARFERTERGMMSWRLVTRDYEKEGPFHSCRNQPVFRSKNEPRRTSKYGNYSQDLLCASM